MSLYRPRVYLAGKTSERGYFRGLAGVWSTSIQFVSSWVDNPPCEPTRENARLFWLEDINDVRGADFVVVFASTDPANPLRGALVEAGAALAQGTQVVLVGDCPEFSTWQHHPLVTKFDSTIDAFRFILGREMTLPAG